MTVDDVYRVMQQNVDASRYLVSTFALLLAGIAGLVIVLTVVQGIREALSDRRQRKRDDELERQRVNRENQLEQSRREYERLERESWVKRNQETEDARALREVQLETGRREHERLMRELTAAREDQIEANRRAHEREMRELWIGRDDRIEQRKSDREQRVDLLAEQSANSVSAIWGVVRDTLAAREEAEKAARDAEKKARELADQRARETEGASQDQIRELTGTIRELAAQIAGLKEENSNLAKDLRSTREEVERPRENERISIERIAAELCRVARHEFRNRANLGKFDRFSVQHDSFCSRYRSTDGDAFYGLPLAISYVRGIAAHHANDPKTATMHLQRVISEEEAQKKILDSLAAEREVDKEDDNLRKRLVVAFYLLGLTDSNFEYYDKADEHFRRALALEVRPKKSELLKDKPPDLLTRIVAAEAARGNIPLALRYLDEIGQGIGVMKAEHKKMCDDSKLDLPFPPSLHKLGNRAQLARVNLKVTPGLVDYTTEIQLLESVLPNAELSEYYIRATLAQVLSRSGADDRARALFAEAYANIQMLGHLSPESITEIRSRVLLLMTAALSAKNGKDQNRAIAEEYLNEATALINQLPTRDGQTCSVFSTISKKNESSQRIIEHIGQIRAGIILI